MEMVLQQRRGTPSTTSATQPPPTMKKEKEDEDYDLRRGPWTVDEDLILINYIAEHGEGRWNALARAAGLHRTGKSCRLRWLNYLRPDVKRGDFTADEQLLILDLHSRWGNRWSKIAQQLPGRTDNEIKNYWRTRVQKHARQLGCDVNSRRFKDAMTYLWMPRLAERAAVAANSYSSHGAAGPQQQPHSSSVFVAGSTNQQSSSSLTATPTPACLGPTDYYHSPGGASVQPSSSSSDSSLTSTESNEEKSNGGWATAMQGVDHEFWSTAAPALQELITVNDNQQQQFQEELITGWVQGFSDDHNTLWSLDDMIWRMQ